MNCSIKSDWMQIYLDKCQLDDIQIQGQDMKKEVNKQNRKLDHMNQKTDRNIKQQKVLGEKLMKY